MIKPTQGYNKLKLLPGIYRIDHTGTIYIPTKFTLDLNQATINLNQFTGNKSLMIELNNTFDSHVINGTIEGDFYSHDYIGSTNNSEWVSGISIGSDSRYSSYKNMTVKNITGYGAQNGIAKNREGNDMYTHIWYKEINNTFTQQDINQVTGEGKSSTNRVTSDYLKALF